MLRDKTSDTPEARFARQGAKVRAETLIGLTRAFVSSGPEDAAKPEVRHFPAIALAMLPYVDLQTRAQAAGLLAENAGTPHALVIALARDAIEAAAPVLENAGIPEGDLASIIRDESRLHALAIARRDDLSPVLVDALILRNDPDINALLISRYGASMLPDQIAMTEGRIPAKATARTARRVPKAANALPDATLISLFWQGDADTRDAVLSVFTQRRGSSMATLASRFGALAPEIGAALVQLAVAGRVKDLISGVARTAVISRTSAARILADPGGEPLALLLAGLDMDRDAANALIAVMTPGKSAVQARLAALFGTMDRGAASRLAHGLAGGNTGRVSPAPVQHARSVVHKPGIRAVATTKAVQAPISRSGRAMPQAG